MDNTFQHDLQALINKHSQENASNTPDFLLAKYLWNCLDNYNIIVTQRDKWNSSDSEPEKTDSPDIEKIYVNRNSKKGQEILNRKVDYILEETTIEVKGKPQKVKKCFLLKKQDKMENFLQALENHIGVSIFIAIFIVICLFIIFDNKQK